MKPTYLYRCSCGNTRELPIPDAFVVCDCGSKMHRDWRSEGVKANWKPTKGPK